MATPFIDPPHSVAAAAMKSAPPGRNFEYLRHHRIYCIRLNGFGQFERFKWTSFDWIQFAAVRRVAAGGGGCRVVTWLDRPIGGWEPSDGGRFEFSSTRSRRPRDRPEPPAAGSAFCSLRRRRPSAPLPDGTQLAPIRRRLIRSRDQSVNKPKTNTRRRPVRPPASIKRRRSAGSEQTHPHGHQSAAGPPITWSTVPATRTFRKYLTCTCTRTLQRRHSSEPIVQLTSHVTSSSPRLFPFSMKNGVCGVRGWHIFQCPLALSARCVSQIFPCLPGLPLFRFTHTVFL